MTLVNGAITEKDLSTKERAIVHALMKQMHAARIARATGILTVEINYNDGEPWRDVFVTPRFKLSVGTEKI